MQRPARIEDLTALHKKVDQLTRKVDKLSKALAEQGIATGLRQAQNHCRQEAQRPPAARPGKRHRARKKAAPRKKATTRAKSATRKSKA